MRDWSSLIGRSDDGTAVLILLSDIRARLMALNVRNVSASEFADGIADARWRSRILAICFEDWSGAPSPRPELLTCIDGLTGPEPHLRTGRPELDQRLADASARLRRDK